MNFCDQLGVTTGSPKFVSKGWGYELIAANNQQYCGKILHFVAGKKCSLHMHLVKKEHFFNLDGEIEIFYSDDAEKIRWALSKNKDVYNFLERIVLQQNQTFAVPVGRIHQMRAIKHTNLMEVSTHDEPEDSIRLIKGD